MKAAHFDALTPREIVAELDRYIIGQDRAKRAVAVALRARWRRAQAPEEIRDEITPKNILMMGPTGVGKTEIARRLAKLAQAPFVKVEASKFTEVGYVGRDVDSMIRDLVETSISLVRSEHREAVRAKVERASEERILDMLRGAEGRTSTLDRESLRSMWRSRELDDVTVEVSVQDRRGNVVEVFSPRGGMEEMGINLSDMLGNVVGGRQKKPMKMRARDAMRVVSEQEADKLIDNDAAVQEAVQRAQRDGIVFIDEIDKVAGREGGRGPDVSREGVQRDLLPIVEGSTVSTKHGIVKTDHMLFIAAGAFHVSKPSDLIPELQGRFPIRVELEALGQEDFKRILVEPKNSLLRQYAAMLETEGVRVTFRDDAIDEIARAAGEANRTMENIGARRLHTVVERVLDELSFHAPDMRGASVEITAKYVQERLGDILRNDDLSRYIL